MDFSRVWTDFAVEAEVDTFGVSRLVAAHNKMMVELDAIHAIKDMADKAMFYEGALEMIADVVNQADLCKCPECPSKAIAKNALRED